MSKGNPLLVTFQRKDYSIPDYIEDVCKEIADHFKVKRRYLHQFCSLIRNSKRWNMENLNLKLDEWTNLAKRIPESSKFVALIQKAFQLCQSAKDLDHLRGGMVEALVIASYGGSQVLAKTGYGWGAAVTIDGLGEVNYRCLEQKEQDCNNRVTVDFGRWDGHHGKFYECKVNPVSIGCKELNYMVELDKKLSDAEISHEIFFVCAETSDRVEMRLRELELNSSFKARGFDNLL